MYILGIESSCDETAAAIVEDGKHLISNVISTSVKEQALYGGVVPEIASRRHAEYISATVQQALQDANMTIADVDAVAVTFAPGLIGAVLVGVNFAKGLAYGAGKPLVPVHHLRGHIAANYLTHPQLEPPFLCLVASGEVELGFQQLAELMNGTISVTSVEGRGSSFAFTLWLERAQSAPAEPQESRQFQDVRALVVDDNATGRQILCDYLLAWGMRVEPVANSDQALSQLRGAVDAADPYAVAFIGEHLGEASGADLAQAIRADPRLHTTRLLLLSRLVAQNTPREKILEAGFHQQLHKPVLKAQLRESLQRALAGVGHGSLAGFEAARKEDTRPNLPEYPKKRILLVEDNPVNQAVASATLAQFHCEVEIANQGQEALDMLERGPYDLVFMDCQMPVMDGFQTTELIRAREQQAAANSGQPLQRTPIVALTAHAISGDRDRCLQAVSYTHLTLPTNREV